MNAFNTLISLVLLISTRLALVQAAVYVTNPVQSTVCTGGQSCDVEWVDDGTSPLLSSIGECTVGLYNGEMVLVQSLTSVDVSSTHSLSFTPNPSAGPNGDYYVVFTSNGITYQGWSATFTLNGMTGSAGSSDSGSSTPIPTTTATTTTGTDSGTSSTPPTTVTSGTITTPSSTGTSSSTHTTTTTSASASATQTGAAIRTGTSTSLAGSLFLALAGALLF